MFPRCGVFNFKMSTISSAERIGQIQLCVVARYISLDGNLKNHYMNCMKSSTVT